VTVVYLHGFASSPASSKAGFFRARFAEAGVQALIPTLDGGDFEHLTITSQLAIVEHVAGDGPVMLMGSSLGGYLAALYAARHREQVARVILMAPAFCFARRWSAGLPDVEDWKRTGSKRVFHYGENRERSLGYALIEDGMRYEDYPDVRQPALVLHGANDPVVPVELSVEFARIHAETATLRVYQSGHELTDVLEPMWLDIGKFLGI
jgi:uncharacterized protein